MLLGGIRYLLPVIEAAHRIGVYNLVVLPDRISVHSSPHPAKNVLQYTY